jgi:hypothetical protein
VIVYAIAGVLLAFSLSGCGLFYKARAHKMYLLSSAGTSSPSDDRRRQRWAVTAWVAAVAGAMSLYWVLPLLTR